MDSKKIRALLTSLEHGSLTSAAEALGYTQSGLTHMMNSLEDELGIRLLIRSKSGVQLSEEGRLLLPRLQELVAADDALAEAAAALQGERVSRIRLGAYSSVARHWLPSVLADFRKISPDCDIEIYVGGMPDIYERLNKAQLDCAFISYQASLLQGLKYIPLRDDPLLAVLPASLDSADSCFPVTRFSGCDFIMPSDGFELDIIPVFGGSADGLVRRVQRINFDDAALVSMIEHGLGLTILSELVMQGMHSSVRCLPLDPPAYRYLGIALSEKSYCDKTIRRFVKSARETLDRLYCI